MSLERRGRMTKRHVCVFYYGSESIMSPWLESHSTQESTRLDHLAEETLIIGMKNEK